MKHWLDSSGARTVSLLAAIAMMLLITVFPRGLTNADGGTISHGALSFVMLGVSAGFVHGVGFIPHNRVLRVVLGPMVAWPGISVALFFYVLYFLR